MIYRARFSGDEAVRARLEAWLEAGTDRGAQVLHESAARRVLALQDADGSDGESGMRPGCALVAKQFRASGTARRLRGGLRALLGRADAQVEWRSLSQLRGRAIAPTPLGLARVGGDWWLIQERLAARSLAEVLGDAPALRRRSLRALGECVAALHAAGLRHGDLHLGNVLFGDAGPRLIDFQGARQLRGADDREDELAFLDASLADWVSVPDRLRVGMAALGLKRPFGPEARGALRRIATRSRAVRRARAVRRTRRWQRPGEAVALVRVGGWRGLRVRELDAAMVARFVSAHAEALQAGDARVWKDDGRSAITGLGAEGTRVVVKQVHPRGLARTLADCVRGSPARRAWRAGHGLRERGLGAARPLAVLERRRLGVPVASMVLVEDLRVDTESLEARVATGEVGVRSVDAVADALAALHGAGVDHGDLKSSHVFLAARGAGRGPRVKWIDLEGLRFRRTLSEARRIRALAQLNGSLADAFSIELRERAFLRYCRRLPFADAAAARRSILALSLARGDVFTGSGCGRAGSQTSSRSTSGTVA